VGALLLGSYDAAGGLVYVGHTGTGFTRQSLLDVSRRLRPIERKTSPFTTTPRTNEVAHWVRPSIVVEIKFNEWTTDGKLRQPVFLGVRDDKSPREVVREQSSVASATPDKGRVRTPGSRRAVASAKQAKKKATTEPVARRLQEIEDSGGSGTVEIDGARLDVTNLGKVFFPATKQTKGDLMRYYARVAPVLLPAIADRPLVMKRYPNGIRGKAFYQHRAPEKPPAAVRVEPVSDEGLTTLPRLIGGSLATLLYVIQLGAISIDPWHSRAASVQFADYSIIDLDPGPSARFDHVIVVAQAVRRVLDELKLRAVPKTSGASGLHVVLPLGEGVPNDGARMIAEIVARRVVQQEPKIATIERTVSARPRGAVYVDYLQNIRGKTVAGVYSARAEPRATVSTPLRWDEVVDGLEPADFTIDTVLPRIQKLGDLWAKGMKAPNTLTGLIGRG
jgi:bifunctional non-homologous end joining protein LigD